MEFVVGLIWASLQIVTYRRLLADNRCFHATTLGILYMNNGCRTAYKHRIPFYFILWYKESAYNYSFIFECLQECSKKHYNICSCWNTWFVFTCIYPLSVMLHQAYLPSDHYFVRWLLRCMCYSNYEMNLRRLLLTWKAWSWMMTSKWIWRHYMLLFNTSCDLAPRDRLK